MIRKITAKLTELLKYRWCVNSFSDNNSIFLTFDDGPEPGITEFVLDTLASYKAKATFFCVGDNIEANKSLYERIIGEGHSLGSHTMSHLRGSTASNADYIKEADLFNEKFGTKLFRPPFGQLSLIQLIMLHKKGFKIVLWSCDTKDWKVGEYQENDVVTVLDSITPGDIVLMHFSKKHEARTTYILPLILEKIYKKGLICEQIPS